MNTDESIIDAPDAVAKDELLRLEMEIARRADQLSRLDPDSCERGLHYWIQAEREVLEPRLAHSWS